MSGSRWVITASCLSGSWRSFLYSSSVYSCHLFLISSASVRSIAFLSVIVPIFAWNVSLISLIFLKRALIFPFYCFPLYLCIDQSYDQPRQHIKKQRNYFANKGPSSQSYGFYSSHVWMWELNCKESWALKNWHFWTVVLEKTLESLGLQGKSTSPS